MSGVLGSIGGFLGKAAPAIAGGSGILGLIGNIMNAHARGGEIDKLKGFRDKFANLTPEQFSSLVTRSEQPLSQDLLNSVGNTVQARMGERGLAQAPGIFAAEEMQALAPYRIAEQEMAMKRVLAQLGIPIEYGQTILNAMGGSTDISKLLGLLMNQNKGGGGGAATPGVTTDPFEYPA